MRMKKQKHIEKKVHMGALLRSLCFHTRALFILKYAHALTHTRALLNAALHAVCCDAPTSRSLTAAAATLCSLIAAAALRKRALLLHSYYGCCFALSLPLLLLCALLSCQCTALWVQQTIFGYFEMCVVTSGGGRRRRLAVGRGKGGRIGSLKRFKRCNVLRRKVTKCSAARVYCTRTVRSLPLPHSPFDRKSLSLSARFVRGG